MNKTTTIVAMAALSALAMVPTAQSTVLAHSWLDVAAGADFGTGAGLYDPTGPVPCLYFSELYVGASPVLLYHVAARYWVPSVGVAQQNVGLVQADPTNCLTLVPGNSANVDYVTPDAGGAFYSWNLLGASQVAALGDPATKVTVKTCLIPNTIPGPAGVGPANAFLAEALTCPAGFSAATQLFPGCKPLPASTAVGSFNLDNPVFTGANACNSVQTAPALLAGDYAVQHCVSVRLFDTVLGLLPAEVDQDHFVVFNGGNLAAWALAGGVGSLFVNGSNFSDSTGASSPC